MIGRRDKDGPAQEVVKDAVMERVRRCATNQQGKLSPSRCRALQAACWHQGCCLGGVQVLQHNNNLTLSAVSGPIACATSVGMDPDHQPRQHALRQGPSKSLLAQDNSPHSLVSMENLRVLSNTGLVVLWKCVFISGPACHMHTFSPDPCPPRGQPQRL